MNRRLKRSLLEQKQIVKPNVQQIPGLLGIPLDGEKRVEVSGRNSYVYVRLRSNTSEVIQAFNNQVASAYNLPVLVERQGNRYTVIGVDTQRYENNWNSFAPFLPRHGSTHSFDLDTGGGGDIVWVYPRQFTPLLIMPSGSAGGPNVIVNPYTLKMDDGTWKYVGNTGTANLTTHNPVSSTGAVLVLIYLDTITGNPNFVVGSGSVFLNSITGASHITPYIPSVTDPTWIPLGAVRLITGTNKISWDNIYDVRQFLHNTPTGTGGGGGGGGTTSTIKENGGTLGTADTFDFVGNGIGDVSISGTTVRVFTDVEDGPQAFGYNYVITPSVSSGALTVALKTIAGNDPSPTDKLVFRVGDSRKEITSAFSHTIPTGTNWCNAGGSEIGEQQTDWFVYLINETGASAGLKIGISRIPYAQTMSDFVNSSTNEKYIAGNWVNFNNSDKVENIGLISATLSSINRVWSMVNPYTISRPVYETRWMNWSPTYSASGSMTFTSVTTNVAVYKISGRDVRIHIRATGTTGGTASTDLRATLPFEAEYSSSQPPLSAFAVDGTAVSGFAFVSASTPDLVVCRKYDTSNYGLGSGRVMNVNGVYQIAS